MQPEFTTKYYYTVDLLWIITRLKLITANTNMNVRVEAINGMTNKFKKGKNE